MNTRGMTISERLDHYSIPVPHCGCHLWLGGTTGKGYGVVSTGGQSSEMAHRVSWRINRGEIPDGMHVLHRCDMPPCINPDHLFLGSNRDNIDDKMSKGRASLKGKVDRNGSKNPSAILSEKQVFDIRTSSEETRVLAPRYEVHRSTIIRIRSGASWNKLTHRAAE